MKKVFALVASLSVLTSSLVFAHGKDDVVERDVAQMESYQEYFDINNSKPGKYNILATAHDKGGNTTIGGPWNIYIDPESDLPVAGITNPVKNMRIPGNLNIVGTCIDDDGVDFVDIILDGDVANPVRAEGKEFWSYYLDTNELEEGVHTIEVWGTDINGLRGKSVKLSWHLDRRPPVIAVTNLELGQLVSGKIDLKGTITDGNGIKSLTFSTDNGEHFYDAKISQDKKDQSKCTFSVPIDTRLFDDGPTVCWFKATDKQGSIGLYSFLYFIDNTKPDIQIVSPAQGEVQNGIFTVAGFAKDVVGMTSLSWEFGGEKGEFELIPGNPYWYKEVNTIGMKKDAAFTITGIDVAGNKVTVKRNIPLNQEDDKPVVTIETPAVNGEYEGLAGTMFVRGSIKDDDEVASVIIKLDPSAKGEGGTVIEVPCDGVFSVPISVDKDLSIGKHIIAVSGKDINGIEGNPTIVTFSSKGSRPAFTEAEIKGGNADGKVTPGMTVHPESGASFVTSANAPCGIEKMSWKMEWGSGQSKEETDIKGNTVSIPATAMPWGLVKITVTATDKIGRTVTQLSTLNVMNLARIYAEKPGVYFDDNTVKMSSAGYGVIYTNPSYSASGYFVGGNARSVEIVPSTPFATARLDGNSIKLNYGNAMGMSSRVRVRVTTDQNLTYESVPLVFQTEVDTIDIGINGMRFSSINEDGYRTVDSFPPAADGTQNVHVSGRLTSQVPLSSVKYRIFSAQATVNKGLVTGIGQPTVSELFSTPIVRGNEFDFELTPDHFPGNGVYVVEVLADNGKVSSAAMFVQKLPPKPSKGSLMKPTPVWFDGNDVYCYVVSQESFFSFCALYSKELMKAGDTEISLEHEDGSGKKIRSKYKTSKGGFLDAHIDSINGAGYVSGMKVTLPKDSKDIPSKLVVVAESDFPITSASYKIEGSKLPGGNSNQSGKGTISAADKRHYNIEIPLANLPAGRTRVSVECNTGKQAPVVAEGTIYVVRDPNAETDDVRRVYWAPSAGVKQFEKKYIIEKEGTLCAYANVPGPVSANLTNAHSGLTVSSVENVVMVKGVKEGIYENVQLRVKDSQGAEYTSPALTLVVDSEGPVIEVVSPTENQWLQNALNLNVKATDMNDVVMLEYSIDNGENWNAALKNGNMFTASVNLTPYEEGFLPIDIVATDGAGNKAEKHISVFKDITPPEVQVVIPCAEDIINGENYIAFLVKDNGKFVKAEYVAPQRSDGARPKGIELERNSMITTLIGTKTQPNDELMSFDFTDASGNVATYRQWEFIIDNESDLPRAEVHLPEEDAVLTRDFEFSGVIYDDDGPCTLWYKFDNGQYRKLPEPGTSFSLPMELTAFTDNEHSITIYAEDVHGVKGPEFVRNFRISLEEPKGGVLTPPISETVKNSITMTGIATDKNGIKKVFVSLDNGNSYNEAVANYGHENIEVNWKYTFDTRVIQDGTHVVFLKIQDWYGIEALYSALINIDNTFPEVTLELPVDNAQTRGMLFLAGYTMDNVNLVDLRVKVRSLEGKNVPASLEDAELPVENIITKAIDLSTLMNGFYNVEVSAKDAADNVTRVSRNILLNKNAPAAKVDLLYPLNGEHVQGSFNIYGTAHSEIPIDHITLFIDGTNIQDSAFTASGYYKFSVDSTMITDGEHRIKAIAYLTNGSTIISNEQTLIYNSIGPWVTIDSFTYGDFAFDRPYVQGNSGYTVTEEEIIAANAKDATKEFKTYVANKSVERVEISFNNGKTFKTVSRSAKWRYRIENGEMPEGYHFLLVRATMKNGEVAVTRLIVQIDKTSPTVRIISPGEGGHFNQQLDFSGLTRDDVALKNVTIALRKGDKASYEVPGFLQGLYLDWQFWGASLFNIGLGLSFFDDNVKLQFQWGQFTKSQWKTFGGSELGFRYGGDNILGIKLLANVYNLPFKALFGPDFEWLYMNFCLGANFSYFSDSGAGKGQFLSALLVQVEFPRIQLEKQKVFRTIAFYTEGQFWLCPSDVAGSGDNKVPVIVPQVSFGIRVNVF